MGVQHWSSGDWKTFDFPQIPTCPKGGFFWNRFLVSPIIGYAQCPALLKQRKFHPQKNFHSWKVRMNNFEEVPVMSPLLNLVLASENTGRRLPAT
jgi:hypothetical protein